MCRHKQRNDVQCSRACVDSSIAQGCVSQTCDRNVEQDGTPASSVVNSAPMDNLRQFTDATINNYNINNYNMDNY